MLFALLVAAQPVAPPPRPVGAEPALRRELLARAERDQEARTAALPLLSGGPIDPEHPALRRMAEVDTANRAWLKGVVERSGWPGASQVGPDGAHAGWLLVQHADADRPFQKKCLELLRAAVAAGEADGKDLAYLTDRVLVGEGEKQVYGTQLAFTGGKLTPSPIVDEAGVDGRRKAVGLGPLAEYLEGAARMYAPPAKKP
ncbi:MAG: hypothetical protein K2X87_17065 [Gemmataceae bacterium]|nr:hypothetical protein [Gemmataceae bacterium]